MQVKLSTENIRLIALFEKVAKVHAKDCLITESSIYFLIQPDMMGMAIGKNGENIKQLKRISGKNVKIFAYSANLEEFIKNIIPSIKGLDVNGKNVSVSVGREEKLTVIGRNGENINAIRDILKRHFGVENFKLK